MNNSERLALALIVLGVLSRLIPHPPNMTAVVGVSLLGWHSSALFTYAGMLCATLIGRGLLLPTLAPLRLAGASFLASFAFFVISNFGVWLGGYYGYGLDGLIACYAAAIPFWGNSLVGDLGSTAMLFGLFIVARRSAGLQPRPENT